MRLRAILLSLAFFLFLGGCRASETVTTPTPLATRAPTIMPASLVAVQVRLPDLVNNPSRYEGVTVQVTGQYGRLPRLICDGETYRPPAQWALTSGEVVVQAAGYESMLRTVAGASLILTVEGRWQRWQGLVGCGREASQREMWYLDVSRIVAPNPIVHVTPLPGAGAIADIGATATATLADPDDDFDPPATPLPPPDVEEGDDAPLPATPTAGAEPLTPIPTPPPVTIITPTPLASPPGALPPPGTTPPAGTPTLTPTGTPASTPADPAPGATPTPQPLPQEQLVFDEFVKPDMAANTVHLWPFTISGNDVITLTVVPDVGMNLAISVRDPGGQWLVSNQDNGAAGAAETFSLQKPAPGNYELYISQTGGTPGHYALALLNEKSQPVIFAESLTMGDTKTGILPADTDHLRHFFGTAGQVISIVLTPRDNSDLAFGLSGPTMDQLAFIDDGAEGDLEMLANFTLPENGFYTIWIQEFYYARADYQLALSSN